MKNKKIIVIALAIVMLILAFIPTYKYTKQNFSMDYSPNISWNGSGVDIEDNYDSNVSESYESDSVFKYGIEGRNENKIGLFAFLIGAILLFVSGFIKSKVNIFLSLAGSVLATVGPAIQMLNFYSNANAKFLPIEIHTPLIIAIVLICVGILSIIISIKGLTTKKETEQRS